jgi:hypothetical protein
VLNDDACRVMQRQLAAVARGRQLQRHSMRRQHEEIEHEDIAARRMPPSFGALLHAGAQNPLRSLTDQ